MIECLYLNEEMITSSWDCTQIEPNSKFRVALPIAAGGSDFVLSVVLLGEQSLQASGCSPSAVVWLLVGVVGGYRWSKHET